MRRKVEENKSIVTKRSEQCETNRCDFKTYDNITTKKQSQKSNAKSQRIVLNRLTIKDLKEAGVIMKKKTNENTSERKAVMRHATDTKEPSNENFVGRLNLQRIDENESIVTKRMEQCETNRFDFKPINNITKKKELQKSNTPNFRIVLKRLTVEDLMEAGIEEEN